MRERLEKVIAHRGLASRREAKDLIMRGLVNVNGKVVTVPGFGVTETDAINVMLEDKESYLVYKPRGIETNKTTKTARDLHDVYKQLKHLSPIGRLDTESEGLIVISNDGTLTKALTKENSTIGKTYLVTVRESVSTAALLRMKNGIVLDRIKTKPAETTRKSRTSFTIVLHEGRKHQIRRMCDACKLTVESLVRIGIGHLSLGSMKSGQSKKLSPKDVELLKH